MISYAMLPPIPAPGAPAPAMLVALRQLERTEARLQGIRDGEPPPWAAQRILIGAIENKVAADVARLLKDLQETSAGGGLRPPSEARASYARVLSPPAPGPAFRAAA